MVKRERQVPQSSSIEVANSNRSNNFIEHLVINDFVCSV